MNSRGLKLFLMCIAILVPACFFVYLAVISTMGWGVFVLFILSVLMGFDFGDSDCVIDGSINKTNNIDCSIHNITGGDTDG